MTSSPAQRRRFQFRERRPRKRLLFFSFSSLPVFALSVRLVSRWGARVAWAGCVG
jgi:hypothetical protein